MERESERLLMAGWLRNVYNSMGLYTWAPQEDVLACVFSLPVCRQPHPSQEVFPVFFGFVNAKVVCILLRKLD